MSFDEKYFSSNTYKEISFAKYSQYCWSNRFYAILARPYGKQGSRLLEIGSGLGHLVGQLEEAFETSTVDVNHWALVQSRPVAPCTSLQVANAENLPFPDGVFGLVVIKHVVEYLPHPEKAIAELGRVIASEGGLILSTPNLASLLKPQKGHKWIGYQDPIYISLKPPSEWLGMIKGTGFKLWRVFADGFWDAPYLSVFPKNLQRLIIVFLGGLHAVSGVMFLPTR